MCKDGGKDFHDWHRNKFSKELVNALVNNLNEKGVMNGEDAKPGILGLASNDIDVETDTPFQGEFQTISKI